jgi:hypothetical protein
MERRYEKAMKCHMPKIFVVSLVVLTILAMGTAYASDAGSQLRAWYQSRFQQATVEINNTTVQQSQDQMKAALDQTAKGLMMDAKAGIEQEQSDASTQAIGTIWMVNGGYVKELRDEKKLLKEIMPGDFDRFVAEKKIENDKTIDRAASDYISDLTSKLDDEVTQSAATITNNATEAAALLSERISTARQGMTTQIESLKVDAYNELKTDLDQTIETGKQKLQEYTNDQVLEQLGKLQEASKHLEEESINELDSLVVKINQP